MSNQLDKLFKDKLAEHTLPPSAQAWTRVEAGLSKKNKGVIVFRIAAAVLLVSAVAATMMWIASRTTSTPLPLTQNMLKREAPVKAVQPSQIEKKNTQQPAGATKIRIPPLSKPKQTTTVPLEQSQPLAKTETKSQDKTHTTDSIQQTGIIQEKVKLASIEKIEKPVVIEYRLETIGSPILVAESPLMVAIPEKSGFRKVIDFALEAKNSSPLGDLREAKDGLFAFNFKKEKQKNAK